MRLFIHPVFLLLPLLTLFPAAGFADQAPFFSECAHLSHAPNFERANQLSKISKERLDRAVEILKPLRAACSQESKGTTQSGSRTAGVAYRNFSELVLGTNQRVIGMGGINYILDLKNLAHAGTESRDPVARREFAECSNQINAFYKTYLDGAENFKLPMQGEGLLPKLNAELGKKCYSEH